MINDQKIYVQLFGDCNSQTINQLPYFVKEYDSMRKQVYSTAFSNEILLLGHYNAISIIDLITREFQSIFFTSGIVISVCIGHYNNFIVAGTSSGNIEYIEIINTIQRFVTKRQLSIKNISQTSIQNLYATNGNILIVITLNEIKFVNLAQFNYIQNQGKKDGKSEIIQSNLIEQHIEIFHVGISSSTYCHISNELIVALGDNSIQVYTLMGEDIQKCTRNPKIYQIEIFDIINRVSVSYDGRLLAVAQCKLINSQEYTIDILDLRRRGKVIKKVKNKDTGDGEIYEMKFFPMWNGIFLIFNSGNFKVYDLEKGEFSYQNANQQIIISSYAMNLFQEYPVFLLIQENGIITQLQFNSPKTECLLQIPFLYFIELRLQEIFPQNYKAYLQQYFQNSYYIGFLGVDQKNSQSQQILLNGLQYFEPLFEGVVKMREFKDFYEEQYNKNKQYRKIRYELPLQIATWGLMKSFQNNKDKISNIEIKEKVSQQTKKKKVKKFKMLDQFIPQQNDGKMLQTLAEDTDIYMHHYHDQNLNDDRYLLMMKLIYNLQYQNLTMLLLGNCSLLFDVRLNLKDLIFELINKVEKLLYLDLSNTGIHLEDLKRITRLTQLKFLDISSNQLGNVEKRPINRMKNMNFEMGEEEEHFIQDGSQFYELLFQKIAVINLRNNNFTDEEGSFILQCLENNEELRVLDISGHNFSEKTRNQLENLTKLKCDLKNTQTILIEFNERISESSMKSLTELLIEKQSQFYIYIVNSNVNFYWDQSLLQIYERFDDNPNDDIKSCIYSCLNTFSNLLIEIFNNIKDNFILCLNQCFCSIYFIQKYIVCCYCVFLQSDYGYWIGSLLGIKTADYEYNNKKDDLKKYLEHIKYGLNIIFWINFIAFYFICIFVPFKFVLTCSGHEWIGHFIYCGYAFLVCILETFLAYICIKFEITHSEFSTGPLWKRAFFFMKDLALSQVAKFDVYSDICFITTVLTCGDAYWIATIAIIVMAANLLQTFYHILQLLLSKQSGKENYIDYLCNYCSFVEIHLVSSLLEKWTIENTTNFLWWKGIPNRVYAATFRTFAEDLPQFLLQIIYLIVNPSNKGIEILMLSLASSTVSIIISITKSISITKANRINDQIMMNEVKIKLKLDKEIKDSQLNQELIQFLHDYYDNFDGQEVIQQIDYGPIDNKNRRNTNYRQIKGQKVTKKIQKGITQLIDQNQIDIKNEQVPIFDYPDYFEPYLLYMKNQQAKLIYKMNQENKISNQLIAEVLLELEISDYSQTQPEFINEFESYSLQEGTFIECLMYQKTILETIQQYCDSIIKQEQNKIFNILDIGCGSGYTSSAIFKLLKKQNIQAKLKCIDHIPSLLKKAQESIELEFEDDIDKIEFQLIEYFNLQDMENYDIIIYGFAIYENMCFQSKGLIIIPLSLLPQEHKYYKIENGQKQLLYQNQQVEQNQQVGQMEPAELQYPEQYEYYEIQKGNQCNLCQKQIENENQFFSPWLRKYYCIQCGMLDDSILDVNNFQILSNLVFIPKCAPKSDKVNSYKLGKNLFPKKDQHLTKYHAIECHPCNREIGEEQEFDQLPRYICLNCRPGKFKGEHCDICYECAKCFIIDSEESEYQISSKLVYLTGHKESHLLLKIHFYFDYNKY